jgi:hypothetical protein
MSAPILRGQLNGSDRAKALNVTANGASPDPWSEVGGMRTALPRYTAKTDRVRGGHTLRRPNRNKKKKPDAVRAEASSKSNDAGRRNTEGAKACFEIAVFAKSGGPLTKVLSLSADGAIKNDPSECRMSRGTARSVQIADVQKLAALIGQLRPNEAISLGALRTDLLDQVKVVTKAELLNGIAQPNIIARTGNNIIYRTGLPAFALLDYDTKGMPPDVEANLGRLGGFWDALVSLLAPLGGVARRTRQRGPTRAPKRRATGRGKLFKTFSRKTSRAPKQRATRFANLQYPPSGNCRSPRRCASQRASARPRSRSRKLPSGRAK